MSKLHDMQEKLIRESVNMINTIGVRHTMGQDWPWTKGMLDHHLPVLFARVTSPSIRAMVNSEVWDEGRAAISDYLDYFEKAGCDTETLKERLDNSGLLLSDKDVVTRPNAVYNSGR